MLLLIHVESNWADESPEEAFETAAWRMQGETLPSFKSSRQGCPKAGVEVAGAGGWRPEGLKARRWRVQMTGT